MLSCKIPAIHYVSNATLVNGSKANATVPYSKQTTGTAGEQAVMVQLPSQYSSSGKAQIVIDASGSSLKAVPEFSGFLSSCLVAMGLLAAILLTRATVVRDRFHPISPG